MMYIIYCIDKPEHNEIRLQHREKHREWLNSHVEKIIGSGPLLNDEGTAVFGSMIIIEAASRLLAEEFAAADPYSKAGLFKKVTITRWQKVLPI